MQVWTLLLLRIMMGPLSVRAKLAMVGSILQLIPTRCTVVPTVSLLAFMMTVILLFMQCMAWLRTSALQGSTLWKSRFVSAQCVRGMLLQAQTVMTLLTCSVWRALTSWTWVRVRGECSSSMTQVLCGVRLPAQMVWFRRRFPVLPPIMVRETASSLLVCLLGVTQPETASTSRFFWRLGWC